MKEFRQLTVADTAEYHKVLIDGYAAIKDYPISFDAIDFIHKLRILIHFVKVIIHIGV